MWIEPGMCPASHSLVPRTSTPTAAPVSINRVSSSVRIAAVCDLDEAKARRAAERFQVPRWFVDAGEMLRAVRPDFVDIVTTMWSHRPLVTLCAAERVPVIVQKPFGPVYADCVAMVEACDQAGVEVPSLERQAALLAR